MAVKLRYEGHVYHLQDNRWRGPDAHAVHLLTWVTDDLERRPETVPADDLDAARKVAERLGEDKAQVLT